MILIIIFKAVWKVRLFGKTKRKKIISTVQLCGTTQEKLS